MTELNAEQRELVEWLTEVFERDGTYPASVLRRELAALPPLPVPEGDDTRDEVLEAQRPNEGLDLDRIEERANVATEGPWFKEGRHRISGLVDRYENEGLNTYVWHPFVAETDSSTEGEGDREAEDDANADFIAHARTDVPALIAEVRRLRAEVETLRETSIHLGQLHRECIEQRDKAHAAFEDYHDRWVTEHSEVLRLEADNERKYRSAVRFLELSDKRTEERDEARAEVSRLSRELAEQPERIAEKIRAMNLKYPSGGAKTSYVIRLEAAVRARSFKPDTAAPAVPPSMLKPLVALTEDVPLIRGVRSHQDDDEEPLVMVDDEPAPVREWSVRHSADCTVSRPGAVAHNGPEWSREKAIKLRVLQTCASPSLVSRVPGGEWEETE